MVHTGATLRGHTAPDIPKSHLGNPVYGSEVHTVTGPFGVRARTVSRIYANARTCLILKVKKSRGSEV